MFQRELTLRAESGVGQVRRWGGEPGDREALSATKQDRQVCQRVVAVFVSADCRVEVRRCFRIGRFGVHAVARSLQVDNINKQDVYTQCLTYNPGPHEKVRDRRERETAGGWSKKTWLHHQRHSGRIYVYIS